MHTPDKQVVKTAFILPLQFNLGFIIAKLNNDLFIVDQVSMPFSLGKTLLPLKIIKAPLVRKVDPMHTMSL